MATIHIARNGASLGSFTEDQLREELIAGRLIGTDLAWVEGMTAWRPLSELAVQFGLGIPVPPPVPATLGSINSDGSSGSAPQSLEGVEPAWERWKEIGFFPAIFRTIKSVLFAPSTTFANMKHYGGFGMPLVFNLMIMTVMIGLVVILEGIFIATTLSHLPSFNGVPMTPAPGAHPTAVPSFQTGTLSPFAHGIPHLGPVMWIIFAVGAVIDIVFAVGAMAAALFLMAGVYHLALKLVGGAKRGFETTFRVYAYVRSSLVLGSMVVILPLLIGFFAIVASHISHGTHAVGAGIGVLAIGALYVMLSLTILGWSIYCHVVGIRAAHGIETWRAVLAVFIPLIICCGGFLSLYAALIYSLMGTLPAHHLHP